MLEAHLSAVLKDASDDRQHEPSGQLLRLASLGRIYHPAAVCRSAGAWCGRAVRALGLTVKKTVRPSEHDRPDVAAARVAWHAAAPTGVVATRTVEAKRSNDGGSQRPML